MGEQSATLTRVQCGGDKLSECLTCEKCLSTCFLTPYYPDMEPQKLCCTLYKGGIQESVDSPFIWACTLCSRCTVDCPQGIQVDRIVRLLRNRAMEQGRAPKRLMEGIEKIKETGNSVGIDPQEFIETVEWLAEEAVDEAEDSDEHTPEVPIDRKGAEFLYLPNPREYTSWTKMFSVYFKFFSAAQADWTYSSEATDISNWAYFLEDEETSVKHVRGIVEAAKRLGVKTLVSTECGHGFKILRQDAEAMLGQPLGFEVISIVELAHRYFKEGRLKLRKGHITERVTYHDPCDVGRRLGIYEEPRELLKYIAKDYVEMTPHGKYSLCCGGGGGVAQNSDMGKKRLENARPKHDQIIDTGATIVASACQACLAQLNDMKAHYAMPVQVKSVIELVVESLSPGSR